MSEEDVRVGARGVIWGRPERAAKGPAPSRTRAQIAAAAVGLADAEGVEAVSIRRVAATLGIAAASLYGYIDDKDELYDLMVDWAEGEDGPPPPLSGDWRTDLSVLVRKIRASILRHPWMASVTAGRPGFGPNSLAWIEHGLAAMDGQGLTIDEMLVASEILHSFARGFASRELAEQQALRRAGSDAAQWVRAITPYIESILDSGRYPRFARVVRDVELPHAPNRPDMLFTIGLERILDGLIPQPVSGTP